MPFADLVAVAEEKARQIDLAEDLGLSRAVVRAARLEYRTALAKLRAHPDYHPRAGVRVGCDWV